MNNKRLIGLDILRILSAFIVYLFHSNMHIKCDYRDFNSFISMGAIFMTAFFLLSGFSLFYSNQNKDLVKIEHLKTFYIKRIIGIFPLYYATAILYILLIGSENYITNLLLAPIEMLGFQVAFTSLFSISHNGGTWFISCLFICYIIYPFIQEVVKQISNKAKIILTIILIFILLYSPYIAVEFSLANIYSNPFFRCIEFIIGVILASVVNDIKENKFAKWIFTWPVFVAEAVLLFIFVTDKVNNKWYPDNYMMYGIIALPMFMLIILTLSGVRCRLLEKSKIVRYLSSISYAFFLAQFFVWKNTLKIMEHFDLERNRHKILISLGLCVFIAILLHELIEKPFNKLCKKNADSK